MKILMLSDLYGPLQGGIEAHVEALSNQLSERGHEVFVCTIGRRDLPDYEEKNGVKIYRLDGLFQKIPFLYKLPTTLRSGVLTYLKLRLPCIFFTLFLYVPLDN